MTFSVADSLISTYDPPARYYYNTGLGTVVATVIRDQWLRRGRVALY